ncbi:MAG TPA: sigma factor-like helix-turn-helix DNA-binding protein, partial [Solirubrobacter sp.]|nr:sigma factor-like helix-turn-helix DNA-binding protein [Solirubrobacter sp.]
ALAMLKPIDREALLLTAWEGLTPERAAVAAGCSRATFDVRLHRARRRLADALPRIEEQS